MRRPSFSIRYAWLSLSFLITIILWSFLFSFSLSDPAWNFAAHTTKYHNFGDVYGAWISDVLFTFLGIMAWLIPPVTGASLWGLYLRRSRITEVLWSDVIARTGGLLLILISGSAISTIFFHRFESVLPAGAGGIIGIWISNPSLLFIGSFGSTILFLALLIAGIPLILRHSWIEILELIGSKLLKSVFIVKTLSVAFFLFVLLASADIYCGNIKWCLPTPYQDERNRCVFRPIVTADSVLS